MTFDRRALHRKAAQAAVGLRDQTGADLIGPVDPYACATKIGVKVMFLDASMEGFYFKGSPARILLSALRPVPRRAFTCAHELGHHVFGHGSTIDELREDEKPDSAKPDEVLANAFAAYFMMPTTGVRHAFVKRGWKPAEATPTQLFTVACEFGVGYLTLLNHLSYTLSDIAASRRTQLQKWTPQRIRQQLISIEADSLVVVDRATSSPTMDIEVGTAIMLPLGATASSGVLKYVSTHADHELYVADRRGSTDIHGLENDLTMRVMPKQYVGPAANRFLEDPDE